MPSQSAANVNSSNAPPATKSEADVNAVRAAYEQDGFVVLKNFLGAQTLSLLRLTEQANLTYRISQLAEDARVKKNVPLRDQFLQLWEATGCPNFDRRHLLAYVNDSSCYDFFNSAEVVGLSKFLLQTDDLMLCPTVNIRYKCDRFPWSSARPHYDAWYWEEEKNKVFDFLTFWIPMQSMTAEDGLLRLFHRTTISHESLGEIQTSKLHQNSPHNLELGDCLLLDPYIVHASELCSTSRLILTIDFRVESAANAAFETRKFGIRLSTNAADAERRKFLVKCSKVVPPKVNVSTGRALSPSNIE